MKSFLGFLGNGKEFSGEILCIVLRKVKGAKPDERHENRTVRCWSGMTDTREHNEHGSYKRRTYSSSRII